MEYGTTKMMAVSIQPLLDALDRAKTSTIGRVSHLVSIDQILVSSDLRQGLVASIFVMTDRDLEATSSTARTKVESVLLEQVTKQLGTLGLEQLPDGKPQSVHKTNWLSRDDLRRDYGGSYDRYMRA